MKYFKLQQDSNIIGVITSNDFISHIADIGYTRTNEIYGEYVEYNNILYRDSWMQSPHTLLDFIELSILPINENEYISIKKAIENNTIIPPEQDDDEEPIVPPSNPEDPDEVLEFIRSSKLNEMSHICRTTIESGFDLEIRGETKHFSLTAQDQLNLMSVQVMAQTQSLIPYHADGEETDFYTSEEINQIVEAANALKIQHTTYYNSLKTYINSLETIEDISAITYGVEIPDEYKSDVLKVLEQ